MTDWDDAYANAPYIANAAAFPARWASAAAAFRVAQPAARLDVAYGETERARLDLFTPAGRTQGLVLFAHGGFWKAFDKSAWSHLAAGPLARGWAVALPSYTLAPEARISEISRQIAVALTYAAEEISGPLRLCGHSAGGHLVTRAIAAGSALPPDVMARIERVVSISGLHDLRPLLRTRMNDTLRLDEPEAAAESAALLTPHSDCPVAAWAGAAERPEFIRQTELLAEAWPTASAHIENGRHHFDVIEGLIDSESALCAALFD